MKNESRAVPAPLLFALAFNGASKRLESAPAESELTVTTQDGKEVRFYVHIFEQAEKPTDYAVTCPICGFRIGDAGTNKLKVIEKAATLISARSFAEYMKIVARALELNPAAYSALVDRSLTDKAGVPIMAYNAWVPRENS